MLPTHEGFLNNVVRVFKSVVVVVAILLLTLDFNIYNLLTWYALLASFIEVSPSLIPGILGIVLASASPTQTLHGIIGNTLAVTSIANRAYVHKQQNAPSTPPVKKAV
jgi:hypothetical protein